MCSVFSDKALAARFKEVSTLPDVECPVCGNHDNDWPEREGLCCNCWCAAWCVITDAADRNEKPPLALVQRLIRDIVHGNKFREFAEKILLYRQRTGTLVTHKATQATHKREYWQRHSGGEVLSDRQVLERMCEKYGFVMSEFGEVRQ
jgi:hypothetical protein